MSHFVAYILQFQEIIVYKIPPGGRGVYSQPKVYIGRREALTGSALITYRYEGETQSTRSGCQYTRKQPEDC